MKNKLLIGLLSLLLVAALILPAFAATGSGGIPIRVLTLTTTNADKTADFQTSTIDLEEMSILIATVDATEDSGTATVDITIQSSNDRTTWFTTGTTFTQLAATGSETKSIATGIFHRYIRFDCDFTGSGQYDLDLYVTGKRL